MEKVLFIDRDGTIIKETTDEKIDTFEKLVFYPKALEFLGKIARELDFKIVMITNQDGLGTDHFPEETFWPIHAKVIEAFKEEGVVFSEELIDKTYPHEDAETRKPKTGLLQHYFNGAYDLKKSFVIGDRLTDVELAKNLGSMGIFINDKTELGTDEIFVKREELESYIALESNDWESIYDFLKSK